MSDRYLIQSVDPDRRTFTGSAEDIHEALEAAWKLNRHIEEDVEIIDRITGYGRRVGVLSLTWEGDE